MGPSSKITTDSRETNKAHEILMRRRCHVGLLDLEKSEHDQSVEAMPLVAMKNQLSHNITKRYLQFNAFCKEPGWH